MSRSRRSTSRNLSTASSSANRSAPTHPAVLILLAIAVIVIAIARITNRGGDVATNIVTGIATEIATEVSTELPVGLPVTPTALSQVAPTPVAGTTPAVSSAGWYQLFFTRPIYPDKPANRGDAPIVDRFVALINSAGTSIDLAIYEFDLPGATAALVAAEQRGVQVRMVTDTDSLTSSDSAMSSAYAALKAAHIPIVDDQRSAIMHDKFMVVDGRWLWGGSWNFTLGDTYELNNNGILIDSATLAANYETEFSQMFGQHEFGPSKKQGATNPVLEISGTEVRNYFSPQDNIDSKLVALVNSAQKSIYFMAFQFTLDDLGSAMAARAKAGVTVSGVFEKTGSETQYSEYGKLKSLGLPVYQDGNPYIMHHKVIIVDEQTVAFGSYNFSTSAENSNDENSLIINDPTLAAQFVQEFNYVRGVAQNPVH